MKLFVFILMLLPITTTAQIYTVFGELRYANKKTVDFDEDIKFEFAYPDGTRCAAKVQPKENYYNNVKGTEVIFLLDSLKLAVINRSRPVSEQEVTIHCKTTVTHKRSGTIAQPEKDYKIILQECQLVSPRVYKMKEGLNIDEPELFSLISMMNSIDKKLYSTSGKGNRFPATIRDLDRFEENFNFQRTVSFETLMDYYRLCDYLQEYVTEGSFFNSEANKLHVEIEMLNTKLSNITNKDNYDSTARSIMNKLAVDNKIYQEYLELLSSMNEYWSKLKIILFNRANR